VEMCRGAVRRCRYRGDGCRGAGAEVQMQSEEVQR